MKRKINFYPLCEAVIHNDMKAFNTLIDSGVDIDGVDYNHITALVYAAERGKVEMARVLLEKGADIEFRDPYGNTPLLCACSRFKEFGDEMIHLLISYGADVNAENNYGASPKKFSKMAVGFPEIEAFKD